LERPNFETAPPFQRLPQADFMREPTPLVLTHFMFVHTIGVTLREPFIVIQRAESMPPALLLWMEVSAKTGPWSL
jgi:hypothetical protein